MARVFQCDLCHSYYPDGICLNATEITGIILKAETSRPVFPAVDMCPTCMKKIFPFIFKRDEVK